MVISGAEAFMKCLLGRKGLSTAGAGGAGTPLQPRTVSVLSRSGRGRQFSTSEIPERSGAPAAELTRHRCSLVGCGPGWTSLVSEASELQGVHSPPRRGALNSGSAESPSRTVPAWLHGKPLPAAGNPACQVTEGDTG